MKRNSLIIAFVCAVVIAHGQPSAQQQGMATQQTNPQAAEPARPQQQATPLSIYQSEKQTMPYKVSRKVAKQRRTATREGVRDLKKSNNSTAVQHFRAALKADSNYAKAQYNLAIAHGKLQQNDSALRRYEQVCKNSSSTPELRVKAHYNAGNIHLRQALSARDTGGYDGQSLKAAIAQYQAALRLDSHNGDAQHNLSLARQLLRPEQQQQGGGGQSQQNQQNQQQNQDQQQNQQQQNQQNQQQNQQQDQQQQQQQNQQNQQQNQEQKQQDKQQDKKQQEQKRREAEQMLNAMKNNEQQTMKAIRMKEADKERRQGRPAKIEKDW